MRYCCPQCNDHPLLDENLGCMFCGGFYKWESPDDISEEFDKEDI